MAKFKFTKRPETIAHTVRAKGLDGKELTLKVEYKYRSRSEFAALADAGENLDLSDSKLAEIVAAVDGRGAEFLLDALASWDLDEELNLENAQMMFDQHQAVAAAIVGDYRTLCMEGRLGN